jgi:4-hydroxybenzoyl-CoA reductase subunit beta
MNSNRLPRLTYFEPKTIDEARELKKEFGKDAAILAGGTDILPLLKRRNLDSRYVINIKSIPELGEISSAENGGLKIGASITLRDITDSLLVSESYPLLVKAASAVAYNQIRNMATLVGNLCVDNKCPYFNQFKFWWQSRPDCFRRDGNRCYVVKGGKQCVALSVGDTVPALIALEAEILIAGPDGQRKLPIEKFYTGDGQKPNCLDEQELVTAVQFQPSSADWRDGYLKKSVRGSVDFSIASLAIRLKTNGKRMEDIRIALNGVTSKPIRAKMAESYLLAKSVNDKTVAEAVKLALKESTPLSSITVPVSVRKSMIGAMFEDLFEEIIQ